MSFQPIHTHTSVALAAITIAAAPVVIPTLAEGNVTTSNALCGALSGVEGYIVVGYNPLLANYAAAVTGNSATPAPDPAHEPELRAALANARAALEAAQQSVLESATSAGGAASAADTASRGLDQVDRSQVDDAIQARIIEALVIQKMNAYRANAGLPELVVSDTVTTDARARSEHISDGDDFNHDPDYKHSGAGKPDGGGTTYASESIAYNHRESFGDRWDVYGTSRSPMQVADAFFNQQKNPSGRDKNMLTQNSAVGVGAHIAKHDNFTCIYGTQKFYAITGGSSNVLRFHTIGDIVPAYGFDGTAFNTDNTNYISGLAGDGGTQRANSWRGKVGSLLGVALLVDVSSLPIGAGSATPAISTPVPADTVPSAGRQQAVIDTQASVNAARVVLDEYLVSAEEKKPVTSLVDIDAEPDRVVESIAPQVTVRPEKGGGVVLQGGENAGRCLTTTEYHDALAYCMILSVEQNSNNLSVGDGIDSTLDQQALSDETPVLANGDKNPPVGQEPGQTPTPSVLSAVPSAPVNGGGDPASKLSAPVNGDGNPSVTSSVPANGDATPAAPEASIPADDQDAMTTHFDIIPNADPTQASVPATQDASTLTQAHADILAATGTSSVWVGMEIVVVPVVGAGAVVASRRVRC